MAGNPNSPVSKATTDLARCRDSWRSSTPFGIVADGDSHGLERRSPKDSDVEPKGRLRVAPPARTRRTGRVGGDVYPAMEGGSIRQARRPPRGCASRHAPPTRPVITALSG